MAQLNPMFPPDLPHHARGTYNHSNPIPNIPDVTFSRRHRRSPEHHHIQQPGSGNSSHQTQMGQYNVTSISQEQCLT